MNLAKEHAIPLSEAAVALYEGLPRALGYDLHFPTPESGDELTDAAAPPRGIASDSRFGMGSADDDVRAQRYPNATVCGVSRHCQFKQKGFFNRVVALSPPQHRRFIELDALGGSYAVDPSTHVCRNST